VIAITREVSSALADCELTHLPRTPIDVELARRQHGAYERALIDAGYRIERLPSGPDMPDSVFVEDIAVVFDEIAIVTRPGARPRRAEVPAVVEALRHYRPLAFIEPPAIVDGGDVLVAGRTVYVGQSTRTNDDAIAQMRRILAPLGYTVCALPVRRCLHLKSAVTEVSAGVVLANPEWIDRAALGASEILEVDPSEPSAANALRLHDRIVLPEAFPRTADRLRARGLRVETVDASELQKAEGAVTCCSLIVKQA
jgi:dimethylargininase